MIITQIKNTECTIKFRTVPKIVRIYEHAKNQTVRINEHAEIQIVQISGRSDYYDSDYQGLIVMITYPFVIPSACKLKRHKVLK